MRGRRRNHPSRSGILQIAQCKDEGYGDQCQGKHPLSRALETDYISADEGTAITSRYRRLVSAAVRIKAGKKHDPRMLPDWLPHPAHRGNCTRCLAFVARPN